MLGNYSLADVAAATGNGCNNENNSFLWIFALLILGGGFGNDGFGNRNGGAGVVDTFELGKLSGSVATKDSVQNLSAQMSTEIAGVNQNIFNVREQLGNGLSTLGFDLANRLCDLSRQVSECCCSIKTLMLEGFGSIKYDMANFAAQINERIMMGDQRILDRMAQDREATYAAQINQLQLNQALCGVVRYPAATTYTAGGSPFCNPCGY